MGDLSEFSFVVRTFLHLYRWRRIDPVPWAPLTKPLSEACLALVSTAGLVLPDQAPFEHDVKGGDTSFRTIPDDADLGTLIDCHRSATYDHSGIHDDPNLALPIDRLRELADAGVVGSANRRHLSFMGSITAPGRLVAKSAPEAAALLAGDGVDAALLVPV
ncbi:MAG TPA: glycine/sarcosine/betaine reductase selenoprotein B family protein [Thermoanaerobaculia bacterium]|nr:glycine/sarcosine/betaine reductase selenoprotein B family protein [Thermoanaerobaculia bacterium]